MSTRYLIGIGNETMGDDGIGPRVAEALRLPAGALGFQTVIIGHDTLGILSYFEADTERMVLVDCVRMGKAPGECAVFSPDEVRTRKPIERMTTHEGDILRIIELARQLDLPMPSISIVGIEPERVEPDLELSPRLGGRLDEYVALTRKILENG